MGGQAGVPGEQELRCVLLHAPGAVLPGELLTSLSKRIRQLTVCTGVYGAMAEVCSIERGRKVRESGNGKLARPGAVLVVVEPRDVPGVVELMDAVKKYAPQTNCWSYERGANPKILAVVDEDVQGWSVRAPVAARAPAVAPVPTPTAAPVVRSGAVSEAVAALKARPRPGPTPPSGPARLRLAGDGLENGATGEGRGRAGPLLNDEELRMLLSDDEPRSGER
jgi:hypothetical protein